MGMKVTKVTQVVEMECDGCGIKQDFDVANPTPEQDREMTNWFKIDKVVFSMDGSPVRQTKHAHTLECVPAAALKASLIDESAEPSIDLESLRAGSSKQAIN